VIVRRAAQEVAGSRLAGVVMASDRTRWVMRVVVHGFIFK